MVLRTRKDETMKANRAVITSANMDRVTFDVTIHGGVKDRGARTNWNILDLNLTLTGNTVTTKELVLGYISSGRFWIKIQNWLRKLSEESARSFEGKTMSYTAFRAAIAAVMPEGGANAELKAELSEREQEIARLREMLKNSGLTDEQIDAALNE